MWDEIEKSPRHPEWGKEIKAGRRESYMNQNPSTRLCVGLTTSELTGRSKDTMYPWVLLFGEILSDL